jgi:hypothetical protein
MPRILCIPGRRLLTALVAVGLVGLFVLPATGFSTSGIVHFYASFNDRTAQGPSTNKSWVAYGGSSTVVGDQDIFNIVFPSPEDGEVEVSENPGSSNSELVCDFDIPVYGEIANISFSLTAVSGFSDLDVRFDDVGDTGVLDMQFTEDRYVHIENKTLPMPLLMGETGMIVNVTIQSVEGGGQIFTLTLSGPTSSSAVMGMLNLPSLNVADVHFLREAGVVGGRWRIDDVLVTSQEMGANEVEIEMLRN